jgi:hypothetical protein
MNVEIGTEAVQFPEKKYINGIFVAVQHKIICYVGTRKEEFVFLVLSLATSLRETNHGFAVFLQASSLVQSWYFSMRQGIVYILYFSIRQAYCKHQVLINASGIVGTF